VHDASISGAVRQVCLTKEDSMKPITSAAVAGVLLVAGGTSAVALSQSASPESPPGTTLGAGSTVAGTDDETTDDVTTDEPDTTADADDVEATEPEDTTDDPGDDSTGSALGLAHAAAMKVWAQCVADAASGPKADGQPMPPKTACGVKPLGPGQIKQLASILTATEPAATETETDVESTAPAEETTGDDVGAGHEGWGRHGRGHHGTSHHAPGHHGHHG
jgi:cytoskeletal protein RodZ